MERMLAGQLDRHRLSFLVVVVRVFEWSARRFVSEERTRSQ
jgi:hypothetical protein